MNLNIVVINNCLRIFVTSKCYKNMDTIESRLKQFIQMEGISPASFADTLGMQRSGISHLLNGRNHPSYDFITRMLQHYPELSADWLLMGKGKPYKNGTAPGETTQNISEISDTQFDNTLFDDSEPSENSIFDIPLPEVRPIQAPEERKSISKVIIFYSDGSYEER